MNIRALLSLLVLALATTACAGHMGQHPERVADARDKVANEYYRCQPGSAIPRFTPTGGVPDHLQLRPGRSCLKQ